MSAAIVKSESYADILRRLEGMTDLPPVIEFEISRYHLEDLGLRQAVETRAQLKALEREARRLGYDRIDHWMKWDANAYGYRFIRTAPAAPVPKDRVQPLAAEGVINV